MRGILIIIGLVLALMAATFLPQAKDYRAAKSYKYFEQGELKKARLLYFFGKLQGDLTATNNYHVLNYSLTRYNDKASKKKRVSNRKKSFRAFDKLTQKGFVPAAYNAGMFYYRSKAGSPNFADGLKYLDYAAASGDVMSSHAADIMRARRYEKDKKYRAFRKSADEGNGLAAYLYAKSLRFDKNRLRYAEKYALLGAEAGYADAQQFLASYFPRRKDTKDWLERAATNSQNRSLMAASDLADMAKDERDFAAQRRWLELASTPREKFIYRPIAEGKVLRWRGLQSSILADANTSKSAAYDLALMQMDGLGGEIDKAGAIKSLEYADDWADAAILLAELRSGNMHSTEEAQVQSVKTLRDENLKKFDSQKNLPFHSKLRPLMENKQIRYATRTDLKKYANGISMGYSNEKRGYRPWGKVDDCSIGFNCFYLDAAIILPEGMSGAHSATFIISPAVILPKQHRSHNKYIFLNELNVP